MPDIKRLSAPLIVMFGVIVAAVAFAMPANAADPVYPPPAGTQVLGTSASAAGTSTAAATGGLAFTGTTVAGIGALGGLLLVGGVALVVSSKRRKADA